MSAEKVGEIFTAAGQAFNLLGDLTMKLHQNSTETQPAAGKWRDEEIDMLRLAITTFSENLNAITLRIRNRTASQIRETLQKKAFEDAGLSPISTGKGVAGSSVGSSRSGVNTLIVASSSSTNSNNGILMNDEQLMSPSEEVTLNRLNAQDAEVDVEEDLGNAEVKLEFEVGSEDVSG